MRFCCCSTYNDRWAWVCGQCVRKLCSSSSPQFFYVAHVSIFVGRQSVQKDQAQLKELLNNLNKFMSEQKKAEVKVAQLREQLQLMEQVVAGNAKLVASGKEKVSAILTRFPLAALPPPPPPPRTYKHRQFLDFNIPSAVQGHLRTRTRADTHRNAIHKRTVTPLSSISAP